VHFDRSLAGAVELWKPFATTRRAKAFYGGEVRLAGRIKPGPVTTVDPFAGDTHQFDRIPDRLHFAVPLVNRCIYIRRSVGCEPVYERDQKGLARLPLRSVPSLRTRLLSRIARCWTQNRLGEIMRPV
jgi:hypothetical protein